jgi:SAM-dependent methyltransferase
MSTATVWPKVIPPLTPEQRRISDDFMHYWHEVLPKRYGVIDRFNHGYPVWTAPEGFRRTLEIGAGIGEHLQYEKLTLEQEAEYTAIELRENMSQRLRERFPRINVVTGDCQQQLPFADGHFDRILAIHVLEHLPNLPACIAELYRLCDRERGVLSIVIPCEGSPAYTLARRISAQRIFEKRYRQSYRWFIEREHINYPGEIRGELAKYFVETGGRYFPLRLPFEFCNLVIGLTLRPRRDIA